MLKYIVLVLINVKVIMIAKLQRMLVKVKLHAKAMVLFLCLNMLVTKLVVQLINLKSN